MKTNRRDFLKLGFGGMFSALLGWRGLVRAEAEETEAWVREGPDASDDIIGKSWDWMMWESPYVDPDEGDPAEEPSVSTQEVDTLGILADCNAYDQRMRAKFLEAKAKSLDAEFAAMAAAEEDEVLYVYPDGGDDQTGDGTIQNPYATIARALSGEPEQVVALPDDADSVEYYEQWDGIHFVDPSEPEQVVVFPRDEDGEERIQHMILHSESGYAYETDDYGFTWKETDPNDYPI